MKKERESLWGVALFAVLAFVLRAYALTWGLPDQKRIGYFYASEQRLRSLPRQQLDVLALYTYHADEFDMLSSLSRTNPARLDFNPNFTPWGTLHVYTLEAVLWGASRFGLVTLSRDKRFYFLRPEEFRRLYLTGRIVTLVLSVCTVALVCAIGWKLYDPQTAVLSAAFMSVLPLHVICSHTLLPDVPMIFWFCLCLLFCARIAAEGDDRSYWKAGWAAGWAAATKYSGGLVGLVIPVAHLLRVGRNGTESVPYVLRDRRLFVALLCAAAAFLIVCPFVLTDAGNFWASQLKGGSAGNVGNLGLLLRSPLQDVLSGAWLYLLTLLPTAAGLPLWLLMLVGATFAAVRRQRANIVLLTAVTPLFLLCSFFQRKSVHLSLPLLPPLVILSAHALSHGIAVAYSRKNVWMGRLLWSIAVSVFTYTLLYTVAHEQPMAKPSPQMQAADWIRRHVPPGARIGLTRPPYVFTPPFDSVRNPAVIVGYDAGRLRRKSPDYVVISDFEYGDLPSSLRDSSSSGDFLRALFQGSSYREVVRFESLPRIGEFVLPDYAANRHELWHWRFAYPTIHVFQKGKMENGKWKMDLSLIPHPFSILHSPFSVKRRGHENSCHHSCL